MISEIKNLRPDIFGLRLDGKTSEEEVKKMHERLAEALEKNTHLRVLLVIDNFEWENFDAFWQELKIDLKQLENIKKVALVMETSRLKKTADELSVLSSHDKIGTFEVDEKETALKWLKRR